MPSREERERERQWKITQRRAEKIIRRARQQKAVPGLPANIDEARPLLATAAVAHARAMVREVRDGKIFWCGVPLSWFDKRDNERAAIQIMKTMSLASPLAMIDLVNCARAGGDLAYDAAVELIREHKHRVTPMPPHLAALDLERDDPRHPRRRRQGLKKASKMMRNIAITWIVADVCWKFGLDPTRRFRSQREWPCGCSVVAEAMTEEAAFTPELGLAIDEQTVATVWKDYGKIAFPGGLGGRCPWA